MQWGICFIIQRYNKNCAELFINYNLVTAHYDHWLSRGSQALLPVVGVRIVLPISRVQPAAIYNAKVTVKV